MRQKIGLLISFVAVFFSLSACGMTQELDQSIQLTTDLKTTITQQEDELTELIQQVEKISTAYEKDLETQPKTGLFSEETGELYTNFTKRQTSLENLKKGKKDIARFKKDIKHILSKEAVDVDNQTLALIESSLEIIDNNYTSLELFLETGFEQEEKLYSDLSSETSEAQLSIIERTYGSVLMVAEETISNMAYTNNLIDSYQKSANQTNN